MNLEFLNKSVCTTRQYFYESELRYPEWRKIKVVIGYTNGNLDFVHTECDKPLTPEQEWEINADISELLKTTKIQEQSNQFRWETK